MRLTITPSTDHRNWPDPAPEERHMSGWISIEGATVEPIYLATSELLLVLDASSMFSAWNPPAEKSVKAALSIIDEWLKSVFFDPKEFNVKAMRSFISEHEKELTIGTVQAEMMRLYGEIGKYQVRLIQLADVLRAVNLPQKV